MDGQVSPPRWLIALAVLAGLAVTGGGMYYVSLQIATTTRDVAATMPDYFRCRDLAEKLTASKEQAERLRTRLEAMSRAHDWLPRSMWPEEDSERYAAVRQEHDALAMRHNKFATEYYETMRRHNMKFADPATLPPDAPEPLPFAFYPVYIYGDRDY